MIISPLDLISDARIEISILALFKIEPATWKSGSCVSHKTAWKQQLKGEGEEFHNRAFTCLKIPPLWCKFPMHFSDLEFKPPKPSRGYATVIFLQVCIYFEFSVRRNEIFSSEIILIFNYNFKGVLIKVGHSSCH